MPGKNKKIVFSTQLLILASFCLVWTSGLAKTKNLLAEKIQAGWKGIGEPLLMEYVNDLCAEKYAGRLTGTRGYNDAAEWLAGRLAQWGLKPGGDRGTYFQEFPNPYTLVLPGAELSLQVPSASGGFEKKSYEIETDYFPGSTSGSGELTAEVVYVGYGITAPELGYDEYAGLDVRGKIVLVEVEVPVDPGKEPAEFARWRPYSFHQYKVSNAREHGAAGMLYNYPIVNPNCSYIAGLLWAAVGDKVVGDIFQGTGRDHNQAMKTLWRKHRPPALRTMKAVINLDGVGRGRKLYALAARNYPVLWKCVDAANRTLVHADVKAEYFHNRARPRLDAARFMWAGIPTLSFSAGDAAALPYPTYHTRNDRPEILTPGIMADLGRLIFAAVADMAGCQ